MFKVETQNFASLQFVYARTSFGKPRFRDRQGLLIKAGMVQSYNKEAFSVVNFTKVVTRGVLIKERYRLVKLIVRGGFGKTFLAVDECRSPALPCAIEQLRYDSIAPEALKKATALFYKQALLLEELGQHPQIPALLDYFEEDWNLYLVHEFIDGTNLAAVLEEEGVFSEAQIWQLLDNLLPVLKFIHDRQVIHQDIKPQNIIRRNDGSLILVDLGAAKQVTATDILNARTRSGSPEYAAPEQAKGKAVFASDLYSLGVTCINLLTGISPFDLFDAANDCWTWREYLTGKIGDRLGNILDKLIQNAVNCRFRSADEVMVELESWRDRRLKIINYNLQPPSNPPWNCSHVLSANGLSKSVNSVAIGIDDQIVASGNDDKTIRLWKLDTGQAICNLSGHSQAVNFVAFSSRGGTSLLASASDDRTIKLWNVNTKKEISTLSGHSRAVKSVAFSPQGNILASGSWDKTVKLWDVNTGENLCSLTDRKLQISAIAFSLDGQFLASASFDRTVQLYSLRSSEHLGLSPQLCCTLVGHSGHVFAVAFSPDGRTIATASDDNTVKLWDINTGRSLLTLSGHSWSVVAVTFTPDGKTLISASWDKTVKLWKVSTGEHICTLCGHLDSVCAVSVSSTGQVIASGSKDRTVRLWQKIIKN